MNKTELINAVAEQNSGLAKGAVTNVVNSLFDTIQTQVAAGEDVTLIGFGTFVCKERNARNGVNPATGEKIKIAKKKVPAFKPGKAFKDKVANGRKKRAKKGA